MALHVSGLRPGSIRIGFLMIVWAAAGPAAEEGFEQHVHEHGKLIFNVALEGQALSIELDAPADNVIGFEHAPRTDAERMAIGHAASLLQSGNDLFAFPPEAACKFVSTELHAPEWKEGQHHADYEARFSYRCAKPQSLDWMQLPILARLREVHQAEVNVVTATSQLRATIAGAGERVRLR
jgi:hypothetical protein